MSLRVIQAGAYSIMVDGGRPRSRHLGVPLGGPADRSAWMIGNALVGNSPTAPALEIALSGPSLVAEHDVGLCVYGAPFRIERDGAEVPPGATFSLRRGETLAIGGTPQGARAYLCAAGGGFVSQRVLDSQSAMTPIAAGDSLTCCELRIPSRSLSSPVAREWLACAEAPGLVRVLSGAQIDWFDASMMASTEYRVTPASNRMGIRLAGKPLERRPRELISEAVAPGAVQVANDGQCIILGVDGQTIGGYPKLAHVIRADLDLLGQMRPGDIIRFALVSIDQAESAGAHHSRLLTNSLLRIGVAEWIGRGAT
jgi:antagonist of KipI